MPSLLQPCLNMLGLVSRCSSIVDAPDEKILMGSRKKMREEVSVQNMEYADEHDAGE